MTESIFTTGGVSWRFSAYWGKRQGMFKEEEHECKMMALGGEA